MKKRSSKQDGATSQPQNSKVGSDPDAVSKFGGKGDFGIPATSATVDPGGRAKGPEQGTGQTRSGTSGNRTTGVGAPVGPDGSGSGGDIDPDVIGLDGHGGLASNMESERGPDAAQVHDNPSVSNRKAVKDKPAVGKRANNNLRSLDTVDHSGGDATTSGDESSESTNPEIEEISQETDLG